MDLPGGIAIPGQYYEWKSVSKPELIGWVVFYVFTLWMYRPGGTPYLDAVHLITHEAGHPLFSYLGSYILTVAGGTILQLFVPAALALSFAYRGHVTGATFCAFMFFNSLINVGTYMADANARVLPLVAPGLSSDEIQDLGLHDWRTLFSWAGLLKHDVAIGNFTKILGYAGMIGSVAWLSWMRKHVNEENGIE